MSTISDAALQADTAAALALVGDIFVESSTSSAPINEELQAALDAPAPAVAAPAVAVEPAPAVAVVPAVTPAVAVEPVPAVTPALTAEEAALAKNWRLASDDPDTQTVFSLIKGSNGQLSVREALAVLDSRRTTAEPVNTEPARIAVVTDRLKEIDDALRTAGKENSFFTDDLAALTIERSNLAAEQALLERADRAAEVRQEVESRETMDYFQDLAMKDSFKMYPDLKQSDSNFSIKVDELLAKVLENENHPLHTAWVTNPQTPLLAAVMIGNELGIAPVVAAPAQQPQAPAVAASPATALPVTPAVKPVQATPPQPGLAPAGGNKGTNAVLVGADGNPLVPDFAESLRSATNEKDLQALLQKDLYSGAASTGGRSMMDN